MGKQSLPLDVADVCMDFDWFVYKQIVLAAPDSSLLLTLVHPGGGSAFFTCIHHQGDLH